MLCTSSTYLYANSYLIFWILGRIFAHYYNVNLSNIHLLVHSPKKLPLSFYARPPMSCQMAIFIHVVCLRLDLFIGCTSLWMQWGRKCVYCLEYFLRLLATNRTLSGNYWFNFFLLLTKIKFMFYAARCIFSGVISSNVTIRNEINWPNEFNERNRINDPLCQQYNFHLTWRHFPANRLRTCAYVYIIDGFSLYMLRMNRLCVIGNTVGAWAIIIVYFGCEVNTNKVLSETA